PLWRRREAKRCCKRTIHGFCIFGRSGPMAFVNDEEDRAVFCEGLAELTGRIDHRDDNGLLPSGPFLPAKKTDLVWGNIQLILEGQPPLVEKRNGRNDDERLPGRVLSNEVEHAELGKDGLAASRNDFDDAAT